MNKFYTKEEVDIYNRYWLYKLNKESNAGGKTAIFFNVGKSKVFEIARIIDHNIYRPDRRWKDFLLENLKIKFNAKYKERFEAYKETRINRNPIRAKLI